MDIYTPAENVTPIVLHVERDYVKKQVGIPKKRKIFLYYEFIRLKDLKIDLPIDEEYDTVVIPALDHYNKAKALALETAEVVSSMLHQVLRSYYKGKDASSNLPLDKMDFMGRRNLLSSELIKKDQKFWTIPELNTGQKRKKFTRTFTDYIIGRNIFAHGVPVIWVEKKLLCVEFIDQDTKKTAYFIANSDAIDEYHEESEYLYAVLLEMDKLNNQIGKD